MTSDVPMQRRYWPCRKKSEQTLTRFSTTSMFTDHTSSSRTFSWSRLPLQAFTPQTWAAAHFFAGKQRRSHKASAEEPSNGRQTEAVRFSPAGRHPQLKPTVIVRPNSFTYCQDHMAPIHLKTQLPLWISGHPPPPPPFYSARLSMRQQRNNTCSESFRTAVMGCLWMQLLLLRRTMLQQVSLSSF